MFRQAVWKLFIWKTIDTLLEKLERVRLTSNGKWLACCPAHDDKSPSLGIKVTDDGKILLHCFAGCSVSEIVSAIGLKLSDLMPENPTYQKGTKPPRFNKYALFDRLAFESIILSLAVRQLLNFEDLDFTDLCRVVKAEQTINEIVREVRSWVSKIKGMSFLKVPPMLSLKMTKKRIYFKFHGKPTSSRHGLRFLSN